MKRSILLVALLMGIGQIILAQGKYFSRDGHVSFYSETPVEDIEAHNEKMTCVVDFESGAYEFSVLIKSFEFEKALMEEHFNENYLESNTYPKASFTGKIEDFEGIRDSGFPPGVEMAAHGTMTIHGVSREVTISGTIVPDGDGYKLESKFIVKPEDYDIEIPKTVRDNIAKEILVTVMVDLVPLKK